MTDEEKIQPAATEPLEEEPGKDIGSALKGMVSFFTIIRIPVDMKEFDAMERNFWLSPIIGALVGAVAFVVCVVLGYLGTGILLQAVFALATAYIFSKFLHFDGLTDFGDGMICSSGKREDHVRALKDTLVGAGGIGVALTVILMTVVLYDQVGGSIALAFGDDWWAVSVGFVAFACEILAKNSQVAAACFGTPGNGMASRQVARTGTKSLVLSTILTVVLIAVVTVIYYLCADASHNGFPYENYVLGVLAVAGVVMSVFAGWLMARIANRTFGFVNGDILGATNEISRVIVLLMAVVILGVA